MKIIVIMKFVLSSQNVYDYLIDKKICDRSLENPGVEQIQAKNFNLLVTLQRVESYWLNKNNLLI